jgi:hypothetical protein
MRYFLFIISILIKLSVGAQITDTSYFDANWKTVSKGKKFTYYIIFEKSGAKFLHTSYYRNGRKYGSGEFKDDKYEIRDGIFCWNTEAGDTMAIEKFENNVLKYSIIYEGRNPERKRVYQNDSTYYEYGISDRKYIVSKSLQCGEMVYRFYGKDSVADMNYLRFAFRKNGNGSNYHIAKYKMLPWIMGEDGGMTYSLGYEFNFKRVHGIELLATYFDWDIDQEDGYGNPLPPIYNVRRSIQLDYRYYFTPIKKKKDEWKFFVSPFVRYMKWKDYYSEGAVTNYFRNESWNYTTGVVLGFCLDMGTDDGMYTEFFIGPQYIHRKTTEGINVNFISVEQTYLTQKYGIRFGMNFCGLMSREK